MNTKKKITYFIMGFSPIIMTIIHSIISKTNLFLGVPHNSDELCYWRVLYSVSKNGFDFASTCGILNHEAPIGPLGEHGLATLFAWIGPLAIRNIGPHSLFLWNIIILTVALIAFLIIVKPDKLTVATMALIMFGNGVLIEQWYSHMMELPCVAIILICIALQIRYEQFHNGHVFLFIVICVFYASMMRICYIVLLFPSLVVYLKDKKILTKCFTILMYLMSFGALRIFQKIFMKSAENSFNVSNDGSSAIASLISNFKYNVTSYFSFSSGSIIEVSERYFQIIIIAILVIMFFKNKKYTYLLYAIELFTLIFMMILLYEVSSWRDVRTTMPLTIGVSFWLAYNMEIDTKNVYRYMLIGIIILSQVIFVPIEYKCNHPEDRFETRICDLKWVNDIKDSKTIVCLYNVSIGDRTKFELYKALPGEMGIQMTNNLEDIEQYKNISYIISSEEINIQGFALKYISEDFHYIYENQDVIE